MKSLFGIALAVGALPSAFLAHTSEPEVSAGWLGIPSEVELGRVYDERERFVIPFTPSRSGRIEEVVAGCGCTFVEFPREDLSPGEQYQLTVSLDNRGQSGAFGTNLKVKTGDGGSTVAVMRGKLVPVLPVAVNLGTINPVDLPVSKTVELGQTGVGRRTMIQSVDASGLVLASVEGDGGVLQLTVPANVGWNKSLNTDVRAYVSVRGEAAFERRVEIVGKTAARFTFDPPSVSFGVGPAARRVSETVTITLPSPVADAWRDLQVVDHCPDVELFAELEEQLGVSVAVRVENVQDFPVGVTNCHLSIELKGERARLPVIALSRPSEN